MLGRLCRFPQRIHLKSYCFVRFPKLEGFRAYYHSHVFYLAKVRESERQENEKLENDHPYARQENEQQARWEQKREGDNKTPLTLVLGYLGVLVSVATILYSLTHLYTSDIAGVREWLNEWWIARSISNTPFKFNLSTDIYILRKDYHNFLEDRYNRYNDISNFEEYLVVLGEKGTGKTTLILKAFEGKTGVIHVFLSSKIAMSDVEDKLLASTGFPLILTSTGDPLKHLIKIFERVKNNTKKYPILIVEVERQTDPKVADTITRALKRLSPYAMCIVLLTEASALLGLTPDPMRRDFLWVGDFSEEEASDYLTKMESYLNEEIRAYIFENLGTRPVDLHRLVVSKTGYKEFIQKSISNGSSQLDQMVRENSKWQDVFKGLLIHEKLSTKDVMSLTGLKVSEIAQQMKVYHAISFNPALDTYQFYNTPTKIAAKQLYGSIK